MKLPTCAPFLLAALALAPACAERTAAATDQASTHVFREDPGADDGERVTEAVAVLHPTEGNQVRGTVRFTRLDEGLRVEADIQGLPPGGGHGYHVHVFGDCSAPDGTSAGTHFNFRGSSMEPGDDIDRITGNLGNLQADGSGRAKHSAELPLATLDGRYSILGRAVVVHAKPNDPDSPPMGAAGARLACGVIGIADG